MKKNNTVLSLILLLLTACTVQSLPKRSFEASWKELADKAKQLDKQGRSSEATELAEEALLVAKKIFAPDDNRLLTSYFILGRIYSNQGKYEKAEPLLKKSLQIAENNYGNPRSRPSRYRVFAEQSSSFLSNPGKL